MAAAELLFELKRVYEDGAIVEMKIWRVPVSVRGSQHAFKYSLYYGQHGRRLIGYDNEAGKGDHRHYGDVQQDYPFQSIDQLTADFLADVTAVRGLRL